MVSARNHIPAHRIWASFWFMMAEITDWRLFSSFYLLFIILIKNADIKLHISNCWIQMESLTGLESIVSKSAWDYHTQKWLWFYDFEFVNRRFRLQTPDSTVPSWPSLSICKMCFLTKVHISQNFGHNLFVGII